MNYLYLFPNVARAYEILLPCHRIPTLIAAENGDGHTTSVEDINTLTDYFNNLHDRNEFGELAILGRTDAVIIEVPLPDAGQILRSLTVKYFETFDDIRARAKAALPVAEVSEDLSSPCAALLKTAITRLGLGLNDVQRIIEVSRFIAANAQCAVIKVEHLAEAIQYKSVKVS